MQNDPLVDRPVLSFGYVEPSPGGADETETSEDEAYFALEIRFVGIDKVPEMQKSTKDQNSYCRQDLRDDDICDHAAHGVDADPDTHGLRPELGRPDLCKDDIAQRSDTDLVDKVVNDGLQQSAVNSPVINDLQKQPRTSCRLGFPQVKKNRPES